MFVKYNAIMPWSFVMLIGYSNNKFKLYLYHIALLLFENSQCSN